MSKTVGFYGGKFLPIHNGHVYAMKEASKIVDELYVMVMHDEEWEKSLCKSTKVEPIPPKLRVRWWKQITKNMPNVHVHSVYEQQTGSIADWARGAKGIRKIINKPIHYVFSSEESYSPIFNKLYPEAKHTIIDQKRSTHNISATKIRKEGVFKNWGFIPNEVKPYFTKKVVVVGTESCGKSTMVKNLSKHFHASYVEEYGRAYYENLFGNSKLDNITIAQDFMNIAIGHKYREELSLSKCDPIIFIDTEAIVTKYYSMIYSEGLNINNSLDGIIKNQHYDLWLFLEPTVEWIQDGTRSFGEKEEREQNNKLLKLLLDEYKVKYTSIDGDYEERTQRAIELVNQILPVNN